MASDRFKAEQKLVARLIAGDRSAVAPFVDLAAGPIWSTIVALVGDNADGAAANHAVTEALAARNFARLARFDGRSSLAAFLTFDVRDWLAEQAIRTFSEDPERAWRRFERQYAVDIRRLVKRRFPRAEDEAKRDDVFQEICLKLIEDNFRRIRAYNGDHAFTGYILTVVSRLILDLMRRDAPRLRLPAKVSAMSALHRQVFIAAAWRGVSLDPDALLSALLGKLQPDPTLEEIKAALDQLVADILAARDERGRVRSISLDSEEGAVGQQVAGGRSAEDQMIQDEEAKAHEALIGAIRREAQFLAPQDRAFLDLILNSAEPLPARQVAKLMGVPPEEVYRIRQRVQRWMGRLAGDLKKAATASV
jgi:RNA polymerase primary sigma factor